MASSSQQRIVLTGASGTLGRNFLDLVRGDDGVDILLLLRDSSRVAEAARPDRCIRVDFTDPQEIVRAVESFAPTAFVHAAAAGMDFPRPEWFDLIRFNVDASINCCQAAAQLPGCRFVYIGTGLGYRDLGRPLREDDPLDTLHPYGASKAAADIIVRSAASEFGAPLTVLRPFSFTGNWDDRSRLFPSLLRAAREGVPFELSAGEQIRDHCSALDIASGILAAICAERPPKDKAHIYNLGSGSATPLRALIENVAAEIGLDVSLKFGARPYLRYEPMYLVADIATARRELNWVPKHNLAYAVWQLARESFPELNLREPRKYLP
jgi:nucleoside-diphosphate-sugar epimerase